MAERRRYFALDGFVLRDPEDGWVEPGHCYDGVPPSGVLPTATPWVRLVHPTEPGRTAPVLNRYLAELAERDRRRGSGK